MRRRRGLDTGWTLAKLAIVAIVVAATWGIGLLRFADDIPSGVADGNTRTDAIVVLTGGSGRLGQGLTLLATDKASSLFVSGVYRGVDVRQLLQLFEAEHGQLALRIGIGNATNTAGNAIETAEWAAENGLRSLRLVTAASHMPRSLLEFRHAMPDLTVIPHPVFPEHVKQNRWWAWPGTANLTVSEYHKFMMAWIRQRTSRLFGRAASAQAVKSTSPPSAP